MSCYLLLGAGFSRNWGGWLAGEVFDYLLGHPLLVEDAHCRRLLWASQPKGGFERALSELQQKACSDKISATSLKNLQEAVVDMFDKMNASFDSIDFEFNNFAHNLVAAFLTKFDAIFTLNQDLLIERHYLSASPELLRPDRWNGVAMPGIAPMGGGYSSIVGQRWQVKTKEAFKINDRIQPYIKLHGSTNWQTQDGGSTLVIGGNKHSAIAGSPILKWYFKEFEKALFGPNSRLMVIGYGFRDEHINRSIIDAVSCHGLKIFNVSPFGSDHAREVNRSNGAAIYSKEPLDEAFERGIIGASRRGLREVFDGNGLELEKFNRFITS